MPLYEYQCGACGRRFEKIQRFADPPLETCALCGQGPVHKLLSSPAIQFKGSGWYITDYAKKGASVSEGGASSRDGRSATGEKTETKTEAQPEKSSTTESPATTPKEP